MKLQNAIVLKFSNLSECSVRKTAVEFTSKTRESEETMSHSQVKLLNTKPEKIFIHVSCQVKRFHDTQWLRMEEEIQPSKLILDYEFILPVLCFVGVPIFRKEDLFTHSNINFFQKTSSYTQEKCFLIFF